jgi:hypothetical protein
MRGHMNVKKRKKLHHLIITLFFLKLVPYSFYESPELWNGLQNLIVQNKILMKI